MTAQPVPDERRRVPRWLRRATAASSNEPCASVILFNVPKIVFLYPTGVVALLCGVLADVWTDRPELIGGVFLIVFGLNLIVLGFEFPRTTSLMLLCGALAIVFGAILAEERRPGFLPLLHRLLGYGAPVQESVFECLVTNRQARELKAKVARFARVRTGIDTIRCSALCGECAARIEDGAGHRQPLEPTVTVI